ncbi:MAG: hypothetical protein HYZ40_11265 [Rhodospirillales bacterium]|nr:hypothetical protein [Rhodospirillales bacterium]
MVGRSSTSVEMRTPAIASAMVHVFVLAAAVLNLDFFGRTPPIDPEPVMVEFEAIDKKAAAPTVGNPPPQPKDVPIAQETTKAPPPKTADPPPAPPQPKPEVAEVKPPLPTPVEKPKPEPPKPAEEMIALKPKEPEPPKAEEKKPEPPKPAPQVKKPEPPKPAPPKPAPRDKVDSLLDDILKNKESTTKVQTPEQQPKPVQQVTRQAPAAPNLAAVVTASEIEGVRSKIRPCWNFPAGVRDQAGLIVTLVVQMNQDGTPVKADLKEPGRYNNDPTYRAAADAAHRAIMNPRCQPWPLSAEKFNNWRTITFNFDPRDY